MFRPRISPVVPLAAGLLIFLSGCTSMSDYVRNGFKVGPNYQRPAATLNNDWIDASDKRKDAGDMTQWWKVFNDPILDRLVCAAYDQNLTVRQAGSRILQARAQLGITVGSLLPQAQFASGGYASTAVSGETVNGPFQRQRNFGQWNYDFSLAWEIDFWGRFRRTVETAGANLDASVADYDDVLVTLLSDVAANYVQMRTLERRIESAHKNVEIQKITMKKAEGRLKVDANGALTLHQAKALLKQTEASIPELEINLRFTTNRLCTLLGMPPEDLLARLGKAPIPVAQAEVALGIPADLLRRRPDLRRAERQAAAQCAQIGVAQADFFPRIALTGTLGYSAQQFKDLFNPLAFNGTVGPSFQWNVLNYGRILNNVRLQDARFQELTAAYQNQVLVAQQEVENGMVTFLNAQQRARLQAECVASAGEAERLSRTGFDLFDQKGNGVPFTTVSLIQQNKVQQEDTLAQAQGEIALGLIQIYRALGGGWQIRYTGCEPGTVSAPQAAPTPRQQDGPTPRYLPTLGAPSPR